MLEQAQSADEVIQRYAPLLLNERYEARWKLAEHLIGRITKILDDKESSLLIQSAIEHIRLLVGDATGEIEAFEFLGEEEESNISLDLLKLIFWLIDHPQKLRSGKAANMLFVFVQNILVHLLGKFLGMDPFCLLILDPCECLQRTIRLLLKWLVQVL